MPPKLLVEEVSQLKQLGLDLEIVEVNGQCYVLVRGVPAHNPPWAQRSHHLLIAIPATYDDAGLDGFYLPVSALFGGKQHDRAQGQQIQWAGVSWALVSWHYTAKRPWRRGSDSLETHINHCAGFFLDRGVKND